MKIKGILKRLAEWWKKDRSKALLVFIFNLPFVSFSLYYGIRCSGCWADMILKIILFIVYLSLARWSLKTASQLERKSEWDDIDILYDKCFYAWLFGEMVIFCFFTMILYPYLFVGYLTNQIDWREDIESIGNVSILSLVIPFVPVLVEVLSQNKKY